MATEIAKKNYLVKGEEMWMETMEVLPIASFFIFLHFSPSHVLKNEKEPKNINISKQKLLRKVVA